MAIAGALAGALEPVSGVLAQLLMDCTAAKPTEEASQVMYRRNRSYYTCREKHSRFLLGPGVREALQRPELRLAPRHPCFVQDYVRKEEGRCLAVSRRLSIRPEASGTQAEILWPSPIRKGHFEVYNE